MSKVVTIPNTSNPWMCNINGIKYSYPAGTVQEVPDEVADVIRTAGALPAAEEVEKPFPCDPFPPFPPMPVEATQEVAGLVYQAAAVEDAAGEAPTAEEFNALLDSLRDAGIIAAE